MPDERPLSPEQSKALFAEIRADEHAARVRDFGEADAGTHESRMAEAYRFREQILGPASSEPAPVTTTELERAVVEIERTSYDSFLNEATNRALSRMQGRDEGQER